MVMCVVFICVPCQVNLLPGERPRDVYAGVCLEVNKTLKMLAERELGKLCCSNGYHTAAHINLHPTMWSYCCRRLPVVADSGVTAAAELNPGDHASF